MIINSGRWWSFMQNVICGFQLSESHLFMPGFCHLTVNLVVSISHSSNKEKLGASIPNKHSLIRFWGFFPFLFWVWVFV